MNQHRRRNKPISSGSTKLNDSDHDRAKRIQRRRGIVCCPKTKTIWHWNGKRYQEFPRANLVQECLQELGDDSTADSAQELAAHVIFLGTLPAGREMNPDSPLICTNAGMFDPHDGSVKEHDRRYLNTYQINIDFPPGKDEEQPSCPTFLDLINRSLHNGVQRLQIQEFFGSCLSPQTSIRKALFLVDRVGFISSVLLRVLRHICGHQNVAALLPRDMKNPFYLATLYRRWVNISPYVDLQAGHQSLGRLKSLISGDPVMAAVKRQAPPFMFVPSCKLAFSTNKLHLPDESFSQYILQVNLRQTKHVSNTTDVDAMFAGEELSGIFAWSLEGLHRLWKQGGFTQESR